MTTFFEFENTLRGDNLSRLYLLLGPEEFLARRLTSRIIELALGDGLRDFNFAEMDTPNTSAPGLLQELNVYPLGSARRVVLIRDVGSLPVCTQEALEKSLADLPGFITLVLTAERVDRRKALSKAIEKHGVVIELGPLRPAEVKAWIRETLREKGKKISPHLIENIFELTGNDLSGVSNELTNLLEYVGERSTIEQSDVEALVESRRREPIYKLTEHVADRDLIRSWTMLRQLLAEGEHELRILWHLDYTVKRLLRAKCLLEDGVRDDAVAKALQVKPFLKTRFLQQARSFSVEELRRMYRAIVEWDNKFKSSSRWHPDIDLELLVRELCATRER
ncbi:MAG: DNA polymerase III subunit delta [Candidatus Lindowbacteria bacterium]|nr:DNA polymerase III subunit delta [Candidatus Lindowbacteria bacterium]